MDEKQRHWAATYEQRRADALRAAVEESGGRVEGLLVTDPFDVRYLCGLREGCPALLIGAEWALLLTTVMFKDLVPVRAPGIDLLIFKELDREVAEAFQQRGVERVGIQTGHLSVERYRTLCRAIPEERLVPVPGAVARCRAIKDAAEVAATREAVRVAEAAMRQLLEGGADAFVGQTEKQLAARLEYLMRVHGADKQGFQDNATIVGGGPNSAACHHVPTDRAIRRGDPVLFDWGAELGGYRSDMTRVAFVGAVPDSIGALYETVLAAHHAAAGQLRPGAPCHGVDAAARDLILERGGYSTEFRHGLGHGIGLRIHEAPTLNATSTESLREKMIVTVEPGIYLIGTGGVRLEDDYLITADGAENLCSLPLALDAWILS